MSTAFVGHIWKDFRHAFRRLMQAPQFTISVVLVLGVGIGVAASMFSMVNAYRFRPAPVKDGNNLIVLASQRPTQQHLSNVSYPNLKDIRERNSVFNGLVGFAPVQIRIRGEHLTDRVSGQVVTGDFFKVLGVLPSIGRVFDVSDDSTQAAPVVVVSRYFWETSLGSDEGAIGQTFYLNGHAFTLAGVVQKDFRGTDSMFHADLWVPLSRGIMIGRSDLDDRQADTLRVLGYLRPGTSLDQAQANLEVLTARLREEYPVDNRELKSVIMREKSARPEVGFARQFSLSLIFVIAMQIVGLTTACVNVTSLMLARALARQRELALRLALGAARWRIFSEILSESLLLAIASGAVGIIAADAGTKFLQQMRIPGAGSFYMDWRPDRTIFIFTMLVSFVIAAAVTVAPAFAAMRTDLQRWMQGSYGSSSGKRVSRLRYRVVISQFTTVTLALMTAGALRQAAEYHPADLGFETNNRLLMRLSTADAGFDPKSGRQLVDSFLTRVQSIPGVIAADVAEDVRLSYDRMSIDIAPEGSSEAQTVQINYNVVGRNYFETMRIPIVQGRAFNEFDREGTTPVAIVNQVLGAKFWPGQNPVGKRFVSERQGKKVVYEVVGVEKTGRYYTLNEPPRGFLYLPYSQEYRQTLAVTIHTQGDPLAVVKPARSALAAIAPNLALFDVMTQDSAIETGLFGPARFAGAVMGFLGLVQFLIAGISMYGLLSYLTRMQTREIGIRLALGATGPGILALYVRRGAKLAARGVVQGTLVSLTGTWLMRRLLTGFEGIGSFDLATAVGVIALVAAVTTAACYLPIRRILADNPMVALRHE